MSDFRFKDLQIWKDGIEISDLLFDIADLADARKYYKFAEQLRAASMSITNNIAEGAGSFSDKEFANFLNVSRRSVYECANILHLFERRKIIEINTLGELLNKLVVLSKMITNFRKTLQKIRK
jgi:four helix bundle protein